nr:hypothetical protein [Tanacetum cinerariifolium]
LCGNNSHDSYDCQQQFPFVYEQELSYNQNYDEECSTEVSEKQSMEDTMLKLVKICQEKEFLCIHDDIDDLIKSALNSKLLLINLNSQRLDKKEQEVKNVAEQPTERGSLAHILSTKEPENLLNMRYEHLSITPITESDEVTKSNAENLLPIPSECEDDDFEDIEYVKASLSDPKNVSIEEENSVEEENVVQQEEEEIDLEGISQIQDERLINLVKNDIPDDPSNNSLLEEVDLFLSDNSIPSGIENVADDPEGDIRFLEELLIDESILSHESFDSNFEDNPSILRPPPKLPDAETDAGEEILVVMIDKDKFDDDYQFFMFDKVFSLLSTESEDTIFDPAPKPKASARRKRSGSDTSITPPTATTTPKMTAVAKGKQPAKAKSLSDPSEVARTEAQQLKIVLRRSRQQTHISQPGGSGTYEGTGSKPGIPDVPTNESEEELSWNSSDDEGADDQVKDGDEGDEGDESDEGEEDANEDKDGDERGDDKENQETAKYDEQDDAEGGRNDEEESKSDKKDDNEETKEEENFDPIPRTPERVRMKVMVRRIKGRGLKATLEVEDTHVTLTPINSDGQQESSSVSSQFVTSMQNPTSDVVLQNLPTFDSVFRFDNRLKSLEANFSEYRQTNLFAEVVSNILGIVHQYMNQQMNEARIIKEQVKGQVKEQVSRILPRIEQSVNAQLEAKVLTRSSHSSRTSYAVAADLLEMELKKILIEKMEGNKSIQHSDEQRNLYKALVDAYEADKTILDSYEETVILKRRRDDDDDQDEGPFVGSDRGSKRRREGKEPEPASSPLETTTRSADMSTTGSKSRQVSASESAFAEDPPLPLIPDNQGRHVIPFAHFINNDLEYLWGGASSRKYTTSVTKTKAADYENIKWIEDLVPRTMWIQEPIDYDKHALWGVSHWGRKRQQFYGFAVNWEFALDVYSKRRIIVITDLKIMEWHSYNHLDWILLSNLTVEESFTFNVSLRMFTRSIVIQQRVEDLQLGVESYQKRLNLTKPDTYRSDLKQREAYTAYSNPRGFIYQNKDKKNRLMQIDELYKFNDGTLNDVRTALDDRLKGIRIQYLPQTIQRKGDKDRAAAMIQAIDKMLKTRRIMRSLEKFVGGRLYEGDFRMLQRTI